LKNCCILGSRWVRALALGVLLSLWAPPAAAGFLWQMGGTWESLSLRPVAEEPTPNYYGYGVQMVYGYSFWGVWDLGLTMAYAPLQQESAGLGQEDLQWISYGGVMGLRFGQAVYIGLKGLVQQYDLIRQKSDDEVDGSWRGNGAQLSLGGFWPMGTRKGHLLQVNLDLGMATLNRQDAADRKRVVDTFGVSFHYVFSSPEATGLWKRMSTFF